MTFRQNYANLKAILKPHKILITNFNFLTLLQLTQLLFPLITYPYLIRVIGKELVGLIVYAGAITAYFTLFINFGFNISEIKEISIHRNNKPKVSEIISSVIVIRSAITIVSIIALILLVSVFDLFNQHKYLYFAYVGVMIDAAINPSFYFLGIEKMKFISIFSIIAKLIFVILIFVLVKVPEHYLLVPLFTSIGSLVGSFAGLYIVFFKHHIKFKFFSFQIIKHYMKESVPFFSSRLSLVFNTRTNVLLIGSFLGFKEVAYYDLAEKLTTVMKIPFNIINQVLYPNVSRTKNILLVKKVLKVLLLLYIIIYLTMLLWGKQAILILGSKELLPALKLLYILGLTSITELVSVFLGAPMLLISGYKKEYNFSIIYGSLFYFIVIGLLYSINNIALYQLAITAVLTSSFVLAYRLYYCKKYKLM
jgi:PST family polysaccharide transporter